jgi:Flp pilus assembly protein TadG
MQTIPRTSGRRPDNITSANRNRPGVAAVELALCAPLLIVLAFGMIEVCNLVHLRTRMYSAAYESARLATRSTTAQTTAASSAAVTAYCNSLLQQLGVQGATVSLQPGNLSTVVPEQMVTVTITAPLSMNTVTSIVVNSSQNITAQATLVIE